MKNSKYKNNIFLYLLFVYSIILFQYPFGILIGRHIFNLDFTNKIQPDYLLFWGIFRVFVVLPLVFHLISLIEKDAKSIYLQFGDKRRMLAFTFWGTLIFTVLGIFLYPQFLYETKLTLDNFMYLLPFFSLFAISNAFVEETFFRGSGLSILTDRVPFIYANIIQAFFFALIHIISPMSSNITLFVLLTFVLGLLWGWLTHKSKSLIPAIVLHIVADYFVAISLF